MAVTSLFDLLSPIKVSGDSCHVDTIRIRDFLAQNGKDYEYENVGKHPFVRCTDGRILENPSNEELARCLGMVRVPSPTTYDTMIIGAGPAGLAAAVYAASEGLKTLVIEGTAIGGQAGTSSRIENYLGFPEGISGRDLAIKARLQAQKFGADFSVGTGVVKINEHLSGNPEAKTIFDVVCSDAGSISTRTIVIATGAKYRRPEIPRREEFEGKGIFYHAMHVQAELVRDEPVVVVGGANSAGQAALFLSNHAKHVDLLARRALKETMSQYLISRILKTDNIKVWENTEIREMNGLGWLEHVKWGNEWHNISYVFLMTGAEPNTSFLRGTVDLDPKGFVLTNTEMATSRPGIFAVGDVRSGSVKRVATAVGEGAMVVSQIHKVLP